MWKSVYISGATGSENGIILADEEYKGSCRVTLEKCPKYYAITCGVYGAMVHTVFCGEADYSDKYTAIKKELQEFIDKDTTEQEELEFYDRFTSVYF